MSSPPLQTAAATCEDAEELLLLDWSAKQGRILTAGGRAEELYAAERGFPFRDEELPHHHLIRGETLRVFREWERRDRQERAGEGCSSSSSSSSSPIVGAWNRPLFFGGFESSTDRDERVYNLQTNALFVDLRIPRHRDACFLLDGTDAGSGSVSDIRGLEDLSGQQLRRYARQHVFAGYSRIVSSNSSANNRDGTGEERTDEKRHSPFPYCCTRHHCIDWNFVGKPRSRPNKWWIELPQQSRGEDSAAPSPVNVWKEWAYATDLAGQHYYCEWWERHGGSSAAAGSSSSGGEEDVVLALRKAEGRDGVLVVVGDHFNYCIERDLRGIAADKKHHYEQAGTLVSLIDLAVADGDLETARAWLTTQGGHGRIIPSKGWIIDCAIEFWKEGTPLWSNDGREVMVEGNSTSDCRVVWKGEPWEVFECNLATVDDLKRLLGATTSPAPEP